MQYTKQCVLGCLKDRMAVATRRLTRLGRHNLSMFTGSQPITPTFFLSQSARVRRYIIHRIRGTLSKNTPRGAKRLCRGAPKRKSISVHVSTSGGDEIKPHYNPRTTAYECGMSARMQSSSYLIMQDESKIEAIDLFSLMRRMRQVFA